MGLFDFIGITKQYINMSQENETYDNIPIINSFLTTIHEKSPSPSHRDPARRQTLQSFTKQVDEWFQAQSKALQTKRQRQLLKQNRLKQLQDEFQAQRMKKQKELDQKIRISEKNKNKTLLDIRQKLHKVSQRHNKVFTKVQDQHLKELQQHFHTRKAYEVESSRKSSRLIDANQQCSQDSRHRSLRDSKTKTLQQQMAETKMHELTQRLDKAKTMSREKQEETINKARNHNIQVQSKAREQHDDYFRLYASRIFSKMETAEANKQKMEKKLQKQNEQRHKAYSEKLKRIQTNLRQRQEQQQQKFEELSKKLQKPAQNTKAQRQQRETLNHRRFLSNWQQLQRQKISRADQIIQKHNEITLKNRLFKERKQALCRTVKVEAL